MKGDVYRCPTCGSTIKEGDCPYSEVVCRRTTACRSKGGMRMVKEARRGVRNRESEMDEIGNG